MTESQPRTLLMGKLLVRLLKWVGLAVLLSIFVLFAVLYLYTHRGSRPWIKTPFPGISDWSSLKFDLSRGPCLGTCPIYTVSIDGLGNVVFDGEVPRAYRTVHRTYRSKISETSVRELFKAFQKAQFFWLYSEYVTGMTDAPTYKISIAFDRRKKEVFDYMGREAGMPKEVSGLEAMIDHIAGTSKWLTDEGAASAAESIVPPAPTLITPETPKTEPPQFTVEKADGSH